MVKKKKVRGERQTFDVNKPSHRRAPIDWGIRCALTLVAAYFGYFAVTQSLAMTLQADASELAHKLAPGNGVITGQLSAKLFAPGATEADRIRANRLASMALLQDPAVVSAVVTLGENAQLSGKMDNARDLFTYSQVLSRRDLLTQLWAIQDAGARSNIPDTLKHYDISLRISEDVAKVLYPALASAIIDPKVQSALVETLSYKPGWMQGFISYVGGNSPDPQATASFFQGLRRVRVPIPDSATAALINALISKQQFGQAWKYYASMRKGVNQTRSRDPNFIANLDVPALFDWTPTNDGSISASIQRGDKGGTFTFAAPSSIGGQVLQQVEMLPPGNYVFEGRSENIDQPAEDGRPYWTLSCPGEHQLGYIDLSNSTVANGFFGGHFSVPVGCPVQFLSLNVRPSNEISGVMGQIDYALLQSVR